MTATPTDDRPELPADQRDAAIELADGGLIVYDEHNHSAWVQTDAPLDVASHR
ncbi:DUF7331 family protein [Halorarius halobius]|uniref:DUF7331 family protein n=1 Tax=Halorarius halobius TaxID=2962671 RepID=UPI0020CFA372|nr:hypothetical protein [Halorarius halobius]